MVADGFDPGGERRIGGGIGADLLADRGGRAGGEKDCGVVRRGVGVDGHLVEGLLDRGEERLVGGVLGKRGVGREDAEHGRHVGLDHAGALDEAAHVDGVGGAVSGFDLSLEGGFLGHGVGRHDGHGGVVGGRGIGAECTDRGRDSLLIGGEGQRHADDAGGGHEDVVRLAAERLRHELGGLSGRLETRLSGRGVRVA